MGGGSLIQIRESPRHLLSRRSDRAFRLDRIETRGFGPCLLSYPRNSPALYSPRLLSCIIQPHPFFLSPLAFNCQRGREQTGRPTDRPIEHSSRNLLISYPFLFLFLLFSSPPFLFYSLSPRVIMSTTERRWWIPPF